MRRYDREITDLNEIEKILEKAEILHTRPQSVTLFKAFRIVVTSTVIFLR